MTLNLALPCPICLGPPSAYRLVCQGHLTPVETLAWRAWYVQACADCGMALGVHQLYCHPHRGDSYGKHCAAFRVAAQEETA